MFTRLGKILQVHSKALLRQGPAQNHGRQDLPRDGLEEIRAAARAVPHVVPHQVRDHRGVPGVVLGDVGLHLSWDVAAVASM